MVILGISCHYHESAAALLKDGRIVAASAEERFTRKKHDHSFPANAIAFCLKEAGIRGQDLDYVAFYEKPLVKFERTVRMSMNEFPMSASFFVQGMKNEFKEKLWIKAAIVDKLHLPGDRVVFVPQHLSHAAAAYYPSPFPEAAFLTLDAVGEWTTGSWGYGSGNRLVPLGELRFPHSVGLLYSAVTRYLGFEVNDGEFKVMGMAAYGKPRHMDLMRRLYKQYKDGSIRLNLEYFAFHQSSRAMYTRKLEELFVTANRFDVAASLQKATEEIVLTMMRYIAAKTGKKALVFGGGVALNSVINGLVTRKTKFRDLFAFPASGDDGGSVGAALYLYHHVLDCGKRQSLSHVFLGKGYSSRSITRALGARRLRYTRMTTRKLLPYIAGQLAAGKVIGWYEGRAEFGPRALGHRSILADPREAEMKDIVNSRIKFREEFRPFAPVVLSRFARRYYRVTAPRLAPYMLATFRAEAPARKRAAATVHDDKTSRIQTVNASDYPGNYAKLLEAFYKKTRVPVLLNTSFNLKGEPIVNSPEDAISTFSRSGLDILVLENYVVTK